MDNIEKLLEGLSIPFAYRRFKPYKDKPVPPPPYIVYFVDDVHTYGGDNKNLLQRENITIELYSKHKDKENEAKIEAALNFVEFYKWEEYIDEQKLFLASYEFEIIRKIGDVEHGNK